MKKKHYCIFWTVSVITYIVIIIQGFRNYEGKYHQSSIETGKLGQKWYHTPSKAPFVVQKPDLNRPDVKDDVKHVRPNANTQGTMQIRSKIGILIPVMLEDIPSKNSSSEDLFEKCISSIVPTLETEYDYTFFVGFNRGSYKSEHVQFFQRTTASSTLVVVEKGNTHVQIINSIARHAFDAGIQYFVRTSIQTEFLTSNWTSEAIRALSSNTPPHLGVVGPTCHHSKADRLCIDMVHRTHLNIFFEYYPIEFTRLWVEDWITDVYKPNNSRQLSSWRVQQNLNRTKLVNDKSRERLLLLETLDKVHLRAYLHPPKLLPNALSYCLYGDKQRYMEGVKANLKLMSSIYPGWQLWIYFHKSVPESILRYLRQYKFVKLIDMTSTKWVNRMSWRFLIASNSSIERYLIRDIDSRLSLRERAAVDEWISSEKKFHIMRDHPFHTSYPMSGGMWGGTQDAIPEMEQLLASKMIDDQYMRDMYFLHHVIYPIAVKSALQHDSFSCGRYNAKPFPRPRKNHMDYVGSVFFDGKPLMTQKDHTVMRRINEPKTCHYNPFKIIVITQRDYRSLSHLLRTIQESDYGGKPVHLDIRILSEDSAENKQTIYTATAFKFTHGTKTVYLDCCHLNLSDTMWYKAWKPRSDNERAMILTDDLELSPLWFHWLSRAWTEYGSRDELAAISLDNPPQALSKDEATDTKHVGPQLSEFISAIGLSPNIKFWTKFTKWAKMATGNTKDISLDVSKEHLNASTFTWQRSWHRWANKNLKTLFITLNGGLLVRKQNSYNTSADHQIYKLISQVESALETFPKELEHSGWKLKVDNETDPRPVQRNLTVWSNDFHISPIANIKSLLKPMNVAFIDKSLSGHCHLTGTCARNLKVLTRTNGMEPSEDTRKRFVDAYRDDIEMQSVDIVMCFHPSAMCELFMPLNKRLFVIATTRYEIGRWKPTAWLKWNQNLHTIHDDPKNVVGANNAYDAEYLRYFTGIKPILLPSVVIMKETYTPISEDILVPSMHSKNSTMIWPILRNVSARFKDLKEKYGHYTYQQLCENTAILHIPYQVSVMSLFEQYAMGIPIIAPSPRFLWALHNQYDIVTERTWERILHKRRPANSTIHGVNESSQIPDPNNDLDKEAFMHWVMYADYYTMEHIIQFDSWEHLRSVIVDTDWTDISKKMREAHIKQVQKVRLKWDCLLHNLNWRSCYH